MTNATWALWCHEMLTAQVELDHENTVMFHGPQLASFFTVRKGSKKYKKMKVEFFFVMGRPIPDWINKILESLWIIGECLMMFEVDTETHSKFRAPSTRLGSTQVLHQHVKDWASSSTLSGGSGDGLVYDDMFSPKKWYVGIDPPHVTPGHVFLSGWFEYCCQGEITRR